MPLGEHLEESRRQVDDGRLLHWAAPAKAKGRAEGTLCLQQRNLCEVAVPESVKMCS
jgi:hypothetical protein